MSRLTNSEEIANIFNELLETAGCVKKVVVREINIPDFITTCLSTGELSRYDLALDGERLEDYKLDARFKGLVRPRGFYLSSSRLAMNYLKSQEVADDGYDYYDHILNPTDFAYVQSQILGAMRKSESLDTNLLKESESVSTALIENVAMEGKCHYSDLPFMPLELQIPVCSGVWYNFEVKEMIKEFIRKLISDIKR